jgi:hypothetical protein
MLPNKALRSYAFYFLAHPLPRDYLLVTITLLLPLLHPLHLLLVVPVQHRPLTLVHPQTKHALESIAHSIALLTHIQARRPLLPLSPPLELRPIPTIYCFILLLPPLLIHLTYKHNDHSRLL